jgi:hypothetical protein
MFTLMETAISGGRKKREKKSGLHTQKRRNPWKNRALRAPITPSLSQADQALQFGCWPQEIVVHTPST